MSTNEISADKYDYFLLLKWQQNKREKSGNSYSCTAHTYKKFVAEFGVYIKLNHSMHAAYPQLKT